MKPNEFAAAFEKLLGNLEIVIRGKQEVLRRVLMCFLAEGHLLIEDVPGVGKTSIARALAASTRGSWHRIQFTPDLLPSDVTGTSILDQARQKFVFHEGPVFANVVVADEINRASPKTQSALLEVMEERRLTVDGIPHAVPRPFIVVATQNPIEMDGTYRLPEAQLDRFLMRIEIGYPDALAEREIISGFNDGAAMDALKPVLTTQQVTAMIDAASSTFVADALQDYVIQIAAATRAASDVRLGASPRGSIALVRAARVRAASDGREFVIPEDIKTLASSVLAHRIIVDPEAELRGLSGRDLIEDVLAAVPVPQVSAV